MSNFILQTAHPLIQREQTYVLDRKLISIHSVDRDYQKFITKLIDLFPHEAKGINKFYETCWKVFNCLDSMPLLSIEDPEYLIKVF